MTAMDGPTIMANVQEAARRRTAKRDEHEPPDVVGPKEAAEILGVTLRRFQQLVHHYNGGSRWSYADFPKHRTLEIGRVFDRAEVQAWANDRTGVQLAALRAYRATGTVARAADVAGVTWTTAKRWLRALGVIKGNQR